MKKTILHIILLSLIGITSCKTYNADFNTGVSDSEIYEFTNYVINDLKIADSVHIQKKPFSLFLEEPNRNYFKIVDFVKTDLESDKYNRKKVFSASDTVFIKQQNSRLINGFEWNKRQLGFKENKDNPMIIALSIPYFSKDKKTVVIYKRYNNTSAFMSGGATLLKYTKTESGWKKDTVISSLN